MTKGGARNRSGPAADPRSERSEKRGYKLTALPSEGYSGEVPEYPLGKTSVYLTYYEDKKPVKELDEGETEFRWERELELWAWAWTSPQACAWSMQPWRWHSVAMWVRTAVVCESSAATAADKNSLHRFADQIGLTPAGLKENGWAIAEDEVGARRAEFAPAAPARPSSRSKLKVVVNGGD